MDGELGILPQAAAFEVEQHLAPAPGAFAEAIGHGQQFLAAVFIRPDDHQNALFFLSHPRLEVNAIRPDVEKPPRAKVALLPGFIVRPPVGLQPRDGLGRQAPGVRTQQGLQGFREVARGHALEVKPRQNFLDRPGLAQMARQDAGREGDPVRPGRAIPHARHLHRHRPHARQHVAFRQVSGSGENPPLVLSRQSASG